MRIFGGVRRSAAAWVALVIAASGLMVVGAAAPATAAVVPCTATVRSSAPFLPSRPADMDGIRQVALTLGLGRGNPEAGDRQIIAARDQFSPSPELPGNYRVATASADAAGTFTFSSEAGFSFSHVTEPGTYPAGQLLGTVSPYGTNAHIEVYESVQGAPPRDIVSWTLVITFSECDSDGDAVTDRDDNCPTAINPDQADLDGDRVGNTCDGDVDGDGTSNAGDNCPMLANDQTDSDGDAIGNACDSTPFPPAPPTGTTTGTTTSTTTTLPTGSTQLVAAARTVSLKYAKRKRVFRGVVTSAVGSCAAYAEASLWRKKRGADRRLVVSTTDEAGTFRTPRVRKRGKYYAIVEASPDGACAGGRSPVVRIRRR